MSDAKEPIDRWRAQTIEELTARFRDAGCIDEPQQWASSEQTEDIAQYSRYLFLRGLWKVLLQSHEGCLQSVASIVGTEGLGDGRAEDLSQALAGNLGELAFRLLYLLSGPGGSDSHDLRDDDPRWRLMEELEDRLTGRDLGALFESLWSTHPGGEEEAEAQGWL